MCVCVRVEGMGEWVNVSAETEDDAALNGYHGVSD